MSIFKKYNSIENSYQTKWINRFLFEQFDLKDEKFVVLEKLHGSNIQLIFVPGDKTYYIGSRNQLADDNFFGINHVLADPFYNQLIEIGHYLANAVNAVFRFYGEIYGPGIQKGIDYKEKGFRIFDAGYDLTVNDEKISPYMPWDLIKHIAWMHHLEKYLVPEIDVIPFEEIFTYDPHFVTNLNPVDGNICEGVVVKPLNKEYTNRGGSRFILKIKNPEFKEKQGKKKKKNDKIATELLDLKQDFLEYITDMRLQGIFSKYGPIFDKSEIGKFIGYLREDAIVDFNKYHDNLQLNKKDRKFIFNCGKEAAMLIKEHL